MPLKVIGAGFGRTGTLSLKQALETLGFGKCHHMLEVASSRQQIDDWWRISRGEAPDWEQVFSGFQATTDFPACVYYEQHAARYPDAKVILTVRDEDSWYTSMQNTLLPVRRTVPGWLLKVVPPARRLVEAVDAIVWQNTFANRAEDETYAKSVFRAHNEAVQQRIPADRLLVFQVKEGWVPLCAFLEVPVPDEPFPNVNDTAAMQRRIALLRAVRYAPLALLAAVVIALLL